MTCIHCFYEWSARVIDPKACPRCKSRQDVSPKSTGYVYIIRFDPGFIKIGFSADPLRRITMLEAASTARSRPDIALGTGKLIGTIEATPEDESALHQRFAKWLCPGTNEWFIDNPELLAEIATFPFVQARQQYSRVKTDPALVSAARSEQARAAWGKLSADERKARQQRLWAKRKAAGRDNPRTSEQIQGA